MAGIYIHIPFCKQKCTYCDFFTIVAPSMVDPVVKHIAKEIKLRKDYLPENKISTIYFGGGTPSLLSADQFQLIFDAIYKNFEVLSDAEITFEANPDDLTQEFFDSIRQLPFNRISIGVQSFDENDLKAVNRRHTGDEAIKAVKRARNNGFNNLSIDLIYGLPGQTLESWQNQLKTGLALNAEHISIYGLTFEEGTVLWKQRSKGLVQETKDEVMIEMYDDMLLKMRDYGYDQYEISNFCKPGFKSRHNGAYWKMIPYLGVGPSAHSFDGENRSWNVSSNKQYMEKMNNGESYSETEILTEFDRFNDYVMVTLRTSEGINLEHIDKNFKTINTEYFSNKIEKYLKEGLMKRNGVYLHLTTQGISLANMIISDLFQLED